MSLPYFPLYIDDFEAATTHLTVMEDGAYNRLLRLMWRTAGCSIPDDEAWIFRRMRAVSDEEKEAVLSVINEFCERSDGRVFSTRLMAEFAKAQDTYNKRSSAGRKGGKTQAIEKQQNHAKPGLSRDKAGLKQPEPEPEPDIEEREPKGSPKKRASRLPEDWILPDDFRDWCSAEWPGIRSEFVHSQADRFKDYWIGKSGKDATKADWMATWRNWMRKAVEDAGRRQAGRGHGGGPPSRSEPKGADWFFVAAEMLGNEQERDSGSDARDRDDVQGIPVLTIEHQRRDG